MTDDLVKQWDEYVESMGSVMGDVEHMTQQMRDRIEALTAERDGLLRCVTDNHVALCRAEAAEAERDRLREERDAILSDSTIHSDQREKYERLCARIAAGKASQQDAVDAIRQLCRDNERLALRRSDALAALKGERDRLREALSFYANDGWKDRPLDPPTSQEIETFEGLILDFPTPEVLFDRGDRARAALKGETP